MIKGKAKRMETTDIIRQYKTIPAASFSKEELILPTLGALCSGGLPLICVSFERAVGQKALAAAANTFPDMFIGAFVSDRNKAEAACRSGVRFVCSRYLSNKIFEECTAHGIRYIPGCLTPTEIQNAADLGMDTVLLSPSCVLPGPAALERYISLYPQIKFIVDCTDEPQKADEFSKIPGLLGVMRSDIVSGSLDDIAAKSSEAYKKFANGDDF